MSDLDGLHVAIRDTGFEILHESFACDGDWTRYEETLAATEADGAPDTLADARRIRERRALLGGTDTLGFALLALSA